MSSPRDPLAEYPVPDGVFNIGAVSMEKYSKPLVAVEGDGCYLRTETGDEYLDYLLGSGPMIVGHAHPHVVNAVKQQMERGSQFLLSNPPGFELAERIVDAVPCADQLKFFSSGTEATYVALRLARAFSGKEKILKFAGAYHGWHDYGLKSSSYADVDELEIERYPDGPVDTAGVPAGVSDTTLVAPYNDLDRTREIVEQHADELAGIIVEPIMRSLAPVDGFLAGLRDICDDQDIVLIFDEVVTGFRLAWGGGQEYFGVEPDLATYGKAIGGGTPVSAVVGREEIMELTSRKTPQSAGGILVSGTLNGNPLGAVAGSATLDVLAQSGTYRRLNTYADDFRAVIEDVLEDTAIAGHALGTGPIVDYALTDEPSITRWGDVVSSDMETKEAIDRELFNEGILQYPGGKRYVSTRHGDEELEITAEAFKVAVDSVT